MLPCPECGAWVTPERDQLAGWKESESQHEARDQATFVCPSCAESISEEQRAEMNLQSLLLHEGQTIDTDGTVHGSASPTDTFGFRWSAVNNLFIEAGDVGAEEWKAVRAPDEDNAEKEMRQFVWCVPVAPSKSDHTLLAATELTRRVSEWPRGIVPADAENLTAAIDLGKYLAHWIVVAWEPEARGHVIDYARIEVPSNDLGVEKGILLALRQFNEMAAEGWPVGTADGERRQLDCVWIDAGYMTDTVYEFCKEAGAPFWPAVGRGAAQQRQQWYNRPTSTGSVVKHIGQGFHINQLRSPRIRLIEVNADHWKTWVHTRLATPEDQTGALTFYKANSEEHLALAKHLTAEAKTEEFLPGRGVVTRWERKRRNNHWFDALYNACAAGYHAGVRLIGEKPKPQRPRSLREFMDDGGPRRRLQIDHERWNEMRERYR